MSLSQEPAGGQLPLAAVCGDALAFEQLYDRYADRVFGIISNIIPERETALDLLRHVFFRLLQQPPDGLGDASALSWLLLLARACAVDRLRIENGIKSQACARLEFLMQAHGWLPSPAEMTQIESRRGLLKKTVSRLPDNQSQLIHRMLFKGETVPELAESASEPSGKIGGDLRAALRFIRHRLRAVLGTWNANI